VAVKKASAKPKKPVNKVIKEPIKEKDRKINNEIRRLTSIFKDIEKNKRLTSKGLIEEASFMKATLEELKAAIDINGPIDEMSQGDYTILREHPALKAYNTMVQRYTTVIKQLSDLLPKEIIREISDGFDEFVGGRSD
jgi:hypothetical protein